jgi:hypothetical protein
MVIKLLISLIGAWLYKTKLLYLFAYPSHPRVFRFLAFALTGLLY